MLRFIRLHFVQILLGLGLCVVTGGQARAQYGPYPPYAPAPYYPPPMMPYPPPPMMPYAPPPMMPAAPPPHPAPPPQPAPPHPAPPQQAAPAPAPALHTEPADPEAEHAEAEFAPHGTVDHCPSSIGINLFGRAEFLNRFNDFDNMGALLENRVWFTYEGLDRFNTGLGQLGLPGLPLTQRRIVNLYRGGAEVILCDNVSFVAQGEYVASAGTSVSADAWANPQAMLKWAVLNTDTTVITPVLAFSPETSQSGGELHERESRLNPGVLFFQSLPCDFFVQGGVQCSIALGTGANTFDYALALGGWLYRDPSLNAAGRPTDCFERAGVPFLTGVIGQLELQAENVISHASTPSFDPNIPGQTTFYPGYAEPKNVYDLTMGVTFLLFNHVSASAVYSVPLTGAKVSNSDVMGIVNVYF